MIMDLMHSLEVGDFDLSCEPLLTDYHPWKANTSRSCEESFCSWREYDAFFRDTFGGHGQPCLWARRTGRLDVSEETLIIDAVQYS